MATKHIPKESSTVRSILKYLNGIPGCKAEKTHGGMYGVSGKPDITGSLPLTFGDKVFGLHFEFEVKRNIAGYDATPLQKAISEEWRRAGAIVATVKSKAEVKSIIEITQKEWRELWKD